jgi:hypothetical protein
VEDDIAKVEARLIKEGRVEKKGQMSMAYFNWSRYALTRAG